MGTIRHRQALLQLGYVSPCRVGGQPSGADPPLLTEGIFRPAAKEAFFPLSDI